MPRVKFHLKDLSNIYKMDVRVYDTLNSDDKDNTAVLTSSWAPENWERVWDINHKFKGAMVIEGRGLRLGWFEELGKLYMAIYNGDNEFYNDKIVWAKYGSGADDEVIYPIFDKFLTIKNDKIIFLMKGTWVKTDTDGNITGQTDIRVKVCVQPDYVLFEFYDYEDTGEGFGPQFRFYMCWPSTLTFSKSDIHTASQGGALAKSGLFYANKNTHIINTLIMSGGACDQATSPFNIVSYMSDVNDSTKTSAFYLFPIFPATVFLTEAEDMAVTTGSVVQDDQVGASNDAYVKGDDTDADKAVLAVSTDMLREGKYKIAVRVRQESTDPTDEDIYVYIDGDVVYHAIVQPGTSWVTLVSDEINISEGAHDVEIRTGKHDPNDLSNPLWIDYIAIFPVSSDRFDFPEDVAYDMMKRIIRYKVVMRD